MSRRSKEFSRLVEAARVQATAWLHAVVAEPGPQQSKLATLACVKVLRERARRRTP